MADQLSEKETVEKILFVILKKVVHAKGSSCDALQQSRTAVLKIKSTDAWQLKRSLT